MMLLEHTKGKTDAKHNLCSAPDCSTKVETNNYYPGMLIVAVHPPLLTFVGSHLNEFQSGDVCFVESYHILWLDRL